MRNMSIYAARRTVISIRELVDRLGRAHRGGGGSGGAWDLGGVADSGLRWRREDRPFDSAVADESA